MIELLSEINALHWVILGVALIGLEVVAPSTYLWWPGITAILVGLLSAILPFLPWSWELAIFGVVSVVASVVWHKYFKKPLEVTDRPNLNRRASQYIGRKIVLREAMLDGTGTINIDDSRWRISSENGDSFPSGTRVEIVGVEGVTLKVREAPVEAAT